MFDDDFYDDFLDTLEFGDEIPPEDEPEPEEEKVRPVRKSQRGKKLALSNK